MTRRLLVLVGAVALLLGVVSFAKSASADTTTIKIGTLAPQDSPWGQVFRVWARAVDQKSNSAVQLQWFWNGTQGDELQMVGKIQAGQLDGAAVTAVGLGKINKSVLVFQLPGIFASWEKLDGARRQMKSAIEPKFDAAGVKILGWGDVGAAKVMSNGFSVSKPGDLQGKGVFFTKGDPIGQKMLELVGGTAPKELGVPEILPNLTNGSINVVTAPPLAAEQLQWASRLTHINTMTMGYGVGALIMSNSKLNSLPADAQTILKETGEIAANELTNRIRGLDGQAFARMKTNKTAVDPPESDRNEWTAKFNDVVNALCGGTIDSALCSQAKSLGH